MKQNPHSPLKTAGEYHPDSETLADAQSLDDKECTLTDRSHQPQTRIGAVAGAVGGGLIGTIVAGPLGALVGAVVGGIGGGAAGKVGAELADPSGEMDYWKTHHSLQFYVQPDTHYVDYEPAYRTGYNNYTPGETFEQAEADLKLYYHQHSGSDHLNWEKARPAALAAWQRMATIFPLEKFNRT